MKRTRLIAGTLIVVLAIAGMVFWETRGRELLLMEEVLVAVQDIEEGTGLSASMFQTAHVLKENVVEGALKEKDRKSIASETAGHTLRKRQQVTKEDFLPEAERLRKDLRIFPLKAEWIDARSSSLRKNDWVDIYQAVSGSYLGTYQLAFVKDEADQEIKNMEKGRGNAPLTRTGATGQIHHVEIIATAVDYQNIRAAVGAGLDPEALADKLTLVGVEHKEENR